jgi:hypothetical protein
LLHNGEVTCCRADPDDEDCAADAGALDELEEEPKAQDHCDDIHNEERFLPGEAVDEAGHDERDHNFGAAEDEVIDSEVETDVVDGVLDAIEEKVTTCLRDRN